MNFHDFVIISPWSREGPSFEQTWFPCAKFVWNWYNGSWEDFYQGCNQVWLKFAQWLCRIKYLNFVNVFSLFRYYLPWEKGGVLYFNKLESPSPKNVCAEIGWNWFNGSWEDFYQCWNQVWLKMAQWLWRIRYLNFVNVFSLFRNYLHWKTAGPSFEQTWIPFTSHRDAYRKCGWNWLSGPGEEDEIVKSLQRQRRRRTTDKF